MNPEHLARGWALIAEGAQYISMAYASIDPPLARSGVPATEGARAVSPQPSSVPAGLPDLPPILDEYGNEVLAATPPPEPALKPQVEAGLGKCPVHGKPWSVKPAGVSPRTKEPYDAFWKCAEKDDDTYCKQKPQKIWRDLHPIPGAAAA